MKTALPLLALLLVACGGGATATPTPTSQAAPTNPPTGQATPAPTGTAPASQPAADFTPGSVPYRVVNLADEPVDVYVRTQGLLEAWLVHEGLATGEVTEYVSPPDPGSVVITTAGSGDPTCVGTCDHFLASIGNRSGSSRQSTLVVHQEGVTEYWELPNPEDVGQSANALRANEMSRPMVLLIGRALQDADFGLRVAFAGEGGCAVDEDQSNLLVGGTSVLTYTFDAAAQVALHDPADTGCEEEPLGGPFAIEGEPGSRQLLLLYGRVAQMEAVVLPIP